MRLFRPNRIYLWLGLGAIGSLTGCVSTQPPATLSAADEAKLAAGSLVYRDFLNDIKHDDFDGAAALFSPKGTMTNHALTTATGPVEVAAMLRKFDGQEQFTAKGAASLRGADVLIKTRCFRSLYGNSFHSAEAWITVRQAINGDWQIAYFETFESAEVDQDSGPINPDRPLSGD